MSLDNRPCCRVHLDHRGPTEEIERLVARLINARITYAGVNNDQLALLVDHGDNYPPIEQRDYSDWINWKYSLEAYPASDGIDEAQFALPLKDLLEKLHDAGVKAVPDCDFEELLAPWNWTNAAN
jgi:hypothetical protein